MNVDPLTALKLISSRRFTLTVFAAYTPAWWWISTIRELGFFQSRFTLPLSNLIYHRQNIATWCGGTEIRAASNLSHAIGRAVGNRAVPAGSGAPAPIGGKRVQWSELFAHGASGHTINADLPHSGYQHHGGDEPRAIAGRCAARGSVSSDAEQRRLKSD